MKPFTLEMFVTNNHSIPNLDESKFRFEINPLDGFITLYTVNQDTSLTRIIEFSDDSWYASVRYADLELAFQLGLIKSNNTRENNVLLRQILDYLYYSYNPIKYASNGGKIYKKTYKGLIYRLGTRWYVSSKVTHNLTKVVTQYILNEMKRNFPELDETSQLWRKEINKIFEDRLNGHFVCCYLTGKILTTRNARHCRLSGKYCWIDRTIEPESYQYYYSENGNGYLLPNEYFWNGKVYDLTEGQVTCPDCGSAVPHAAFDTEENCCKICIENRYKIHNYTTRVPTLMGFKAKRVTPKTIYLGCELEYETSDKLEASIKVGKLIKNHAIMKHDGSINNGFEVVTCPATLDIHLEEFKNFFSKIPSELSNGPRVGMHVHVSKKPLNYLTQGKITEFMNRSDNLKFIEYIAKRNLNRFCNHDVTRKISYPFTKTGYSERYNTVNLNNQDTIEFRIFATPLTYDDFATNIEFCQALVDYCGPAQVSLSLKQQTYWEAFKNWVVPQRKVYPNLVNFVKGFV